ncbi:MAG: tetratricopeptide repeat protein [Pseudomonadota bacterium]
MTLRSTCQFVIGAGMMAATALGATPAPAQGLAGPYLAAEHAAKRGDIAEASRLFARVLARDPGNVGLMEQTMLHQVAAGQIAQAVAVARKLEETDPGHHLGVLVLSADGLRKGLYPEARDRLLTGGPDGGPFVGPILQAWAEFGLGNLDGARTLLTDLSEKGTGGPVGKILTAQHLGLIEAANGDDQAASTALSEAADASNRGGSSRLIRQRAGVLSRLGETTQALDLVEERLSLTLADRRLEMLAEALRTGETPGPMITKAEEGAAEALFAVSGYVARGNNRLIGLAYARLATYLDPAHVEAQLLIADILSEDSQYGLAIEAYARVPEDAPEKLDAEIGRAQALEDAGELEEGLTVLRELVARHPGSLEPHTSLGDMLRQAARYGEAAVAYDGAVQLIDTPENRHWVLYYQRGITYERSKQWPKAEADFRKALELEPDQPLVLNYLGYSWVEMGAHLDEAREMIEKAVEQRENDGYIVDSLGWVLYRLGQFEEALLHMERAVELRPVDPVINDHYGDVLWVNGRKTEAEFQWRRALSFEPEEKEIDRIRRKLDVGLDVVLEEEAAAGDPAIIGTAEPQTDDNGG